MRHLLRTAFVLICFLSVTPPALAFGYDGATKAQINIKVSAALSDLYKSVPGSQDIVARAAGVLVFPRAGFMVGGQHGGGALRIGSKNVDYYRTDRMKFTVRPGAKNNAVAVAFMTPEALQRFQSGKDWDVGADPSVAVVTPGMGGQIDTPDKPVLLFAYGDKGLMGPVSLAGAKVTKAG